MRVITTGTLKGGTGKTSTLFNLAGILAERHKILLIDADPQTNLSLNCGVDITVAGIKTSKNIFDGDGDAEEIIFKRPVRELPNMDIIPSSIGLTGTELQIVTLAGRENILRNFIQDNEKTLSAYDYILIDTNPSMGVINQNAFLASDSIILVSDISLNGIQGAELFITLWGNIRRQLRKADNIMALIINNFDKRIKLSAELVGYCNENESISPLVLDAVIYNSVQVKNSELEHKPINIMYRNSIMHEAYGKVINELTERGVFLYG